MPSNPVGAMFGGGDRATKTEQLAQIALAATQLENLAQAVESLQLNADLMKIFEQMLGIQTIVEDVLNHEIPNELLEEYEIVSPFKHRELTEQRREYLADIDAEIDALEKEIALNADQFSTLTTAMEAINESRSDIVATQAQFVADQAALEQERRRMALDILKARREEIRNRILIAHRNSQAAALRCIDSPSDVKC